MISQLLYLHKLFHLQWIPVYKYRHKNRHYWCNQRFHRKGWNPQNTHRCLENKKENLIIEPDRDTLSLMIQSICRGRMDFTQITFCPTLAYCTISGESLFTSTAVGTITVGAISIFITRTRIKGTLIDIWWYRKGIKWPTLGRYCTAQLWNVTYQYSYIPSQIVPFPVNPCLHVQL